MADKNSDKDESEEREIVASELDDNTHAEAILLFKDSAQSIFFAKSLQWKTVGGTLTAFIFMIALAKLVSVESEFVTNLKVLVIIVGVIAIFIIGMYQFWQHTEAQKIAAVEKEFSSLWREIRGIKSKLEANLHRYLLLIFMMGIIVIGGIITVTSLSQMAS